MYKVSEFFSALKDGYAFRVKFKDRASGASILASILKGRINTVEPNKRNTHLFFIIEPFKDFQCIHVSFRQDYCG
jgi:hypothetical protein